MKRYFRGLLPDPLDRRDYPIAAFLPEAVAIPAEYRSEYESPVREQGTLGSCVAQASVAGMKEQQERRQVASLASQNVAAPDPPPLSPLFVYQLCKKIDGIPKVDGTYVRVAMKVLQDTGVCPEDCLPYRPKLGQEPCPAWKELAEPYKIKSYASCPADVEAIKAAILEYGGVVAGVYTSYQWSRSTDGLIADLKRNNQRMGGHAIWVCGWTADRFRFKNSWGVKWGDKGYGYLTYQYLEDQMISGWTSVDVI